MSRHIDFEGIETFRDPNGHVMELTSKRANHDEEDPARNRARELLVGWTAERGAAD